ncbi:myb-related protein B-like isoform X2 [Etheostoma cragini]|uniref:myb-related protein B-like isoform X2 n=1 Tax=Etheostoma cragini TaxID=417921 RepID=UPI00155F4C97|nr:myb-related protein B-like isoform X2 [Etheostoma cragini]
MKEQLMNSEDGASFMDSTSSWSRNSTVTFSPSELFSLCGAEDQKLQRPGLTSTPVCPLKHSTKTNQDNSGLHCSHSSQTPSETGEKIKALWMSAPQTPTPLKIQNEVSVCSSRMMNLTWEERRLDPDSQQSSSSEVQGESLLSAVVHVQRESRSGSQDQDGSVSQVQRESGSVSQVQRESVSVSQVQRESVSVSQVRRESGSVSQVRRESSSTPGCDEFGCFLLDGQMEVYWCQQPVGYLHSPECPAYRLNPFELSGELQLVMFGKTEDQLSVTEQARLYVEP